MAALIGALRVDLGANTANFEAGMRRAQSTTSRTARSMQRDLDRMRDALRTFAGSVAGFFTARELVALTDTFTRFQNSLRVAGLEGSDLAQVQGRLFQSAQRFGVELETLGTLYSRANQAAASLGASQQDLLRFTDNVAAAVRVQGGSVEQASGALLQLSQALQAGTVRAEEFNSINEGLFPVLQAVAAGSERFRGSVANLRREVLAGKVSSREFFDAFQNGAQSLQDRAARSAMTTTAAFTQLRNALVVYIGEADKTSGASVALGNAIRLLADNLETVIPALTIIGTALGVGFVSNAVRARIAAAGVTTALGGLAAAGRGLVAVMGGPVGIALTAVTVALGALAISSGEAEAAISRLEGGVDQAQLKLEEARDRAQRAGVAVTNMATATAAADAVVRSIAGALGFAAQQALSYAAAARAAAIASAQLRLVQAREDVAGLERRQSRRGTISGILGGTMIGAVLGTTGPSTERVNAGIAAGRTQISAIEEELRLLQQTPEAAFNRPPGTPAAGERGGRGRKSDADRLREQALRDEAEFQASLRRFRADTLRAQQERTNDTVTRSQIDEQILDIERQDYAAQLALQVATKDLTKVRAEQLLEAYDAADQERRLTVQVQRNREIAEENREIDQERRDIARETLQHQVDMASTAAERRSAESELLELAYRQERARLEEVIADEASSRAAVEKARLRLADLDNWRSREQESINQRNMGPLGSYLESLPTTAAKANEALEQVAVRGLKSLEDGLVDVLNGTKSLAAAFRDMATSIISDLLRIQIQRMITAPLANMLGGGGKGGGIGSFLGSIFGAAGGKGGGAGSVFGSVAKAFAGGGSIIPGFASGGSMRLGGIPGVDRNVLALNGVPIARVSAGETMDIRNGPSGGNTYHISVAAPNTGDRRRDRKTSLQQAADVKKAIGQATRKGV
jgi:tape measure domain-containing protein